MKYLVFITTNLKTNQVYLGIHPTKDPKIFDGYLGSGVYVNQASTFKYPKTPFQAAVKKFGADSFKRYTLYTCDSLEDALLKKSLFNKDFYKQSHVYNTIETSTKINKLYQFDDSGKLVKTWDYDYFITDFYGYPVERFQWAAGNKLQFLGYYWSYTPVINPKEFTNLKGNFKVYYLYDLEGKLIKECYCKEDLEYWGKISSDDNVEDAIKYQTPIRDYYVSNRLMDVFVPKAKTTYSKRLYYVYKDTVFKGTYKGKEILRVLDTYSWKNIRKAMEINKGWYKDFYISFDKVDKVPDKAFKIQIDVYDKFGNFIESLDTLKEVREKYNLTSAKLKNIQLGEKYIDNWIFKYHSK